MPHGLVLDYPETSLCEECFVQGTFLGGMLDSLCYTGALSSVLAASIFMGIVLIIIFKTSYYLGA